MRNANHAQGGALPGLARVDLGYGDVEVGPQPVLHAAHHLPLVFERMRAFNANLEREIGNHSPSYAHRPGHRGSSHGRIQFRDVAGLMVLLGWLLRVATYPDTWPHQPLTPNT